MKAIVIRNFKSEQHEIEISGDQFHHLVNVFRVKPNEQILIINTLGSHLTCEITRIEKKSLFLKSIDERFKMDDRHIHLVLGTPKKEYLEEIMRYATELNIKTIYLLDSEYSQKFEMKSDRVEKIWESAASQCNAWYLPEIRPLKMNELKTILNGAKYIFHNGPHELSHRPMQTSPIGDIYLFIGPEGGWSGHDFEQFKTLGEFQVVNFIKSNILRAVTAVPVAVGYVYQQLKE